MFSISQFKDSDLDPDKNCKNYPFNNFSSYRECDEDFVYKVHLKKYKTMPFWVTDNIQDVTLHRLSNIHYAMSIFIHALHSLVSTMDPHQMLIGWMVPTHHPVLYHA